MGPMQRKVTTVNPTNNMDANPVARMQPLEAVHDEKEIRDFEDFQRFKAMEKLLSDKEKRGTREKDNDDRVSVHTWRSSTTTGKETEGERKQPQIQEGWRPRDSQEVVNQKEYDGTLRKINFRNPFTNHINDTPIPIG
ncbi:unnamed protein product [Lactuca virosa]|uniref:Uncharacterized protein n=1 Tax=Lactuca virosa TaxID=75947 RepID=A0AAU9PDZ8_9ASTR|nr:unnamed protein product [Lactuca virosa]